MSKREVQIGLSENSSTQNFSQALTSAADHCTGGWAGNVKWYGWGKQRKGQFRTNGQNNENGIS